MNPIIRNILAVVLGAIIAAAVNMGLIMLGPNIIPAPDGVDPTNMESLKDNMHLFQAKHFVFPFLAHALGTLAGAFATVKIAVSHHLTLALIIGAFFILGGIQMAMQLPSPMWFNVLDIVLAYFPMAYLGHRIASKP